MLLQLLLEDLAHRVPSNSNNNNRALDLVALVLKVPNSSSSNHPRPPHFLNIADRKSQKREIQHTSVKGFVLFHSSSISILPALGYYNYKKIFLCMAI